MTPEETIYPPDPQKALEWITALCAAGLDYHLSKEGERWVLTIPGEQVQAAHDEIIAFENTNEGWPPKLAVRARREPEYRTWMGLWSAHVILLFYIWLGSFDGGIPFLRTACADGSAIVSGEWWRTITALTLHSGPVHLLANMCFLAILVQAVCRSFGSGVGVFLVLLSGVLGNTVSAFIGAPGNLSVGASTSCFGALGILSVWQSIENYRRYRDAHSVWSRAWIPLGAGLALLGIMGTGPRSDLASHALGFAVGMILSVPICWWGTQWVPAAAQKVLVVMTVAILGGAWVVTAFSAGLLP